jgi:predicted anti-sigma-YlaC factor YlaD
MMMDCDQIENVSHFIDGELSKEEAVSFQAHLDACAICRQVQKDFLSLKQEIKAYNFNLDPFATQRVLNEIVRSRYPTLWRRRIAVPIPLMAGLLLALLTLCVWMVSHQLKTRPSPAVKTTIPVTHSKPEEAGFDLTRFDHGERASIVKIKKTEADSLDR